MDFSTAIAEARSALQTEFTSKAPGFTVALAVRGARVWAEAFGYADLEARAAATTATRFRIGSVSKPLTAAGLALLVERGLLDLDAPVQRYLPDFPHKGADITMRMLAGHLSGIRNYRGREAFSTTAYPNLRSGLKKFEDDPLESAPGTAYKYTSYNYNVIGAAMEAVTGQDFTVFMEENVTKPLGLVNTVPDRVGVTDPERAQFYERKPDGAFFVAPVVDHSFVWPAGGYLSTAEDLVNFGLAMMQPGFLKAESLQLLFTPQKTADGTPTPYGIGWFVQPPIVRHGGASLGGVATLMLHPPSRSVAALAANGGTLAFQNALKRGVVAKEAEWLLPRPDVVVNVLKIFLNRLKNAAHREGA